MLYFSPFSLDLVEGQLWRTGKLQPLRRKPFAILAYLVAHPRRLVTHEELVEKVWEGNVVSNSSVRTHLHELRQVLGEELIETVIGRGYRFTAEPTTVDAIEPKAVADERIIVGRNDELAVLRSALDRAASGHRQLCFVTGEPGIGKSTLVDTFAHELDGRKDVVVVRGHCVEQHTTPEAFLPVIEVLSQLRRSALGDVALAALIRHAPTFLTQIPHLVPDAQLDEVAKRARAGTDATTARELLEAIETICTNHTVVLVLEDLQWCDVATIDLMALLGQRRERARLLVIGTSRRAEAQTVAHPLNRVMRGLIARFGAIALPLERIDGSDIRRLLDLRFPGHAFPVGLIDVLDRITGGTPLFVVSFVEDLVGRRMLDERADRWELTVGLDDVAAHRPESVRQLIDIHLDRLAPEEQRLLEAASVIGIEFSTALVAAALGTPNEAVEELCDSLARRSLFLRRVGVDEWPDATIQARYCVTHGLVQEVSLERSRPTQHQQWRRRIAERLETAYGERVAEIAHVLAIQLDRAGVLPRAVHFYMLAAARSTLRFASRDALALYERAHELLRRMPESRERDVTELALLEGKTQSVIRSTAHSIPLEVFEQMIAIARRLGDTHRLSANLANLSVRLMTLAEYDRSTQVSAQFDAIRRAEALPPEVLAIDVMATALVATWRGELVTACEILERETSDARGALVIPGMIGPSDPRTIYVLTLSLVRWLLGQTERAELDLERGLAQATANGDPYMLGHAHCSRARMRFLAGATPSEIREPAATALGIVGAEVWHPQAALLVAVADSYERTLAASELDDLERTFRARIAEFSLGATYMGTILLCALIRSGETERAKALADELLAFARSRGERILEPELVRLRGTLLEPSAAAAAYLEAIEIARGQQSRSFQLRAAESLAALWRDDSRRAEAQALVDEAARALAIARTLPGAA